ENNLNIFGITAPGWFMKTEYRAAYYDRTTLPETFVGGGATLDSLTFKPLVQTVSTSLVYRFNWSGPVVAKYCADSTSRTKAPVSSGAFLCRLAQSIFDRAPDATFGRPVHSVRNRCKDNLLCPSRSIHRCLPPAAETIRPAYSNAPPSRCECSISARPSNSLPKS